ncbi:hypothetical protein E4U60_006485 [Claviceps pazoutovae]|uniref:Squalene/phytoene synthase n=1 Tax=Claviceps pazoutovae TaxID=1649127 RepID=A0A9P7MGX7_9HYPO|nr:hypothetical protein E4U60_006485 [Claviceps pazoutovae]
MSRPLALGCSLKRIAKASASRRGMGRSPSANIGAARLHCLNQLKLYDYEANFLQRFIPKEASDTYTALRALNVEITRLPNMAINPAIIAMRLEFWQQSINATFAGRPPEQPICILLDDALKGLESRAGSSAKKSLKFWMSRFLRTKGQYLDGKPFPTVSALEDYAENTNSTLMYATLASLPLQSMHVDHLASHIGKACGIISVLRGIPIMTRPGRTIRRQLHFLHPASRESRLLLPLDIMAEEGVTEDDVIRFGPLAHGLTHAAFKLATRAHDHIHTSRQMMKRLLAGEAPGHAFEHGEEAEHRHPEDNNTAEEIERGFKVLLEAVPAMQYLELLQKADFNPFHVKLGAWRLPWKMWNAFCDKSF